MRSFRSSPTRCLLLALMACLGVYLLLPGLAVWFAPGDAGMALCFLLFFAVNPITAAVMGTAAGLRPARRWYFPILGPVVFLFSAWGLFSFAEPAFLWYSGGYLIIGLAAMGITFLLRMISKKSSQR